MNAADGISHDQWQVAIRTLKDLLALQVKKPGAILEAEFPDHLPTAANGKATTVVRDCWNGGRIW